MALYNENKRQAIGIFLHQIEENLRGVIAKVPTRSIALFLVTVRRLYIPYKKKLKPHEANLID